MAEKISIGDIKSTLNEKMTPFVKSTVEDYAAELSSAQSKLGAGSTSALVGALAASSALYALNKTGFEDAELKATADKLEELKKYFLFMIDEEIKARMPLDKRLADGDAPAHELDAAWRTACCIVSEQLYTLAKLVELIGRVADRLCPCAAADAAIAVIYAKTAMESARVQLKAISAHIIDPVYSRTTLREPEICIEENAKLFADVLARLEGRIL